MGALQGREVTIIGAGVAGLTAALAMARRGARVTVRERADELREVGAGLQISPNAGRVIEALGLGPALDAAGLRSRGVRMFDARGRQVLWLDMQAHRPDAVFRVVHRHRLLGVLEQGARAAGVGIRLGDTVIDLPDAALLVGADGLRSRVRQALNGTETPFFTGQTAWRALVRDDATVAEAQIFMGPGRHLVSYPLGHGLRNIVAVQERAGWEEEGWSHEVDPADLRAAFAAFGGPVPGWLAQVERVGIWGLFRHEVATHWQDGRRAILGDAAHPTLPFMAQGAAMAIEDAWVLAACLDADADQAQALARYQALRQPRAQRLVATATANARNYHLKGPARAIAHAGLRALGRMAPDRVLSRFDWIYDFDCSAI